MILLITGGTGFFGKSLLRHFIANHQASLSQPPAKVVVLSRNPENFLAKNPEFCNLTWLNFHQGNIEVPASLPIKTQFTHILHAAADSTDASSLTHLERHSQIIEGTRNMLKFAVGCGAKRFLLTSSGAVYGPQPPTLPGFRESYLGMPDPLSAHNVYGVAKRQAEHLCALYQNQYGIETVIARCFAFVGQDLPLNAHFAIGNFIRDALWNDEIVVAGDGTPTRSYLDQRDLAHWLLTLLEHGQAGHAYNVGSDQPISIAALAFLVRDTINPDKAVRVLGQNNLALTRNRYVPDIHLAAEELGLAVRIGLEEAIMNVARSAPKSLLGS